MVSKLSYINTDAVLENASAFASHILSPQKGSSSTVRHEHYHWGSPGWGYFPQPVYYGWSGGGAHSGKKDYTWVAIPAAAIAFVTMYCIGQNHAEWFQAKVGMVKLRHSYLLVQDELSQAHPALKSTVQSVYEKQMTILDRIRSDAATGLVFKAILVTAVLAAGIGGLAAIEPLLVWGCVGAFAMGCAMLYRAGFNSKDTAIRMEAQELLTSIQQASKVLDEVAGPLIIERAVSVSKVLV